MSRAQQNRIDERAAAAEKRIADLELLVAVLKQRLDALEARPKLGRPKLLEPA